MKKSKYSLGYPIPKQRAAHVIYVNSTPHLSNAAAEEHRNILAMGKRSYSEYVTLLHSFLSALLDTDLHRSYNDYWYELAARGPEAITQVMTREFMEAEGSTTYMMDQLMEDSDQRKYEDELEQHTDHDIAVLHKWCQSLPSDPLSAYERKLFLKYAGDSSRRTGEGYIKQIRENYLASREAWRRTPMPEMRRYEEAIDMYKRINTITASFDGSINMEALRGYLSRARSTTFGGYPYLRNMADFVSDDENDPTTYADLYNRLALGWLYLPPKAKNTLYPSFVALERVQPGGVETYDDAVAASEQHFKANKQRFVQAQSAVISHAYKFLVDAVNLQMRAIRPTMSSDKFGESMVTQEMKRLTSVAFGKNPPVDQSHTINWNVVGTDYTNFDASQDVCITNDAHYMNWRRLAPAWMTYYIIDPYVLGTYGRSSILVPHFGLVRTTGVKSGMCDTNQADTQNCAVADILELLYYRDKYHDVTLTDEKIRYLMTCTMDNGDDRFKLTPCNADDIEAADSELGYIAQKSKQEVMPVGTSTRDYGVTYLKTILSFYDGRMVRTDSIAKLILARMHPETVNPVPHKASLVMDFFMSASRSTESPYLYVLVDYMYARLPLFRDLLLGKIDFKWLIDHMVVEQMERLRLRRGKKWMRRKGMDYDMIIEQFNTKYGYGDEGYRGNVGAITSDPTSLEMLPQVQAIMAIGLKRVHDGTIGSTFLKEEKL